MNAPPDRTRLLARVHIARKEMGLDEGAYRALVARVTGYDSAKDCTAAQLLAVLADMKARGWKPKTGKRLSEKPHVRKIFAIWKSMEPFLVDPSPAALRSFTARQTKTQKNPAGISDPNFLSVPDAKKVIEGLKGWQARLARAQWEGTNDGQAVG